MQKLSENKWTIPLILMGLVVGTFLLRTTSQWSEVFVNGNVLFRGVDPWYQIRLTDSMVQNFPVPQMWDMYATYPTGNIVGIYPLMSWITVAVSKLGFNYEVVAALLPPIAGSLILIPVYFLSKEVFNKGTGIIACLLLMLMPTEIMHRSLLGFYDQHILEALFMVLTILFIVRAKKYGKRRDIVFAGLSLGFYCLNWHGAPLFLIIIGIILMVKVVTKVWKGKPEELKQACRITSIISLIALLISLPYLIIGNDTWRTTGVLAALIISPFILSYTATKLSRTVFLSITALYIISFLIFILIPVGGVPHKFATVLGINAIIGSSNTMIVEARHLVWTNAYNYFGIVIILSLLGLFFTVKDSRNKIFIVWSIILIILMLCQRRWVYYAAIPVSMLASYLIIRTLSQLKPTVRIPTLIVTLACVIVTFISGTSIITTLSNDINQNWYSTMVWLRENTPEPFETETYNAKERTIEPSYGVLAWWDYGHWIIREGKRVPIATPSFQGKKHQSTFFAAQSQEAAREAIEDYNIQYVILSYAELSVKAYAIFTQVEMPVRYWQEALNNSNMAMLWFEENPDWVLIHTAGEVEEEMVKVYERNY